MIRNQKRARGVAWRRCVFMVVESRWKERTTGTQEDGGESRSVSLHT